MAGKTFSKNIRCRGFSGLSRSARVRGWGSEAEAFWTNDDDELFTTTSSSAQCFGLTKRNDSPGANEISPLSRYPVVNNNAGTKTWCNTRRFSVAAAAITWRTPSRANLQIYFAAIRRHTPIVYVLFCIVGVFAFPFVVYYNFFAYTRVTVIITTRETQ